MQTEWRTPPNGILAMEFLPSGFGEICDALREEWGVYREAIVF